MPARRVSSVTTKLPGIGGVEQVFAELLAQHGEPFADDLDACALDFGQLGAREAEVAEFTLDDAASDGRERGEAVGGLHCLVLGEERLVRDRSMKSCVTAGSAAL